MDEVGFLGISIHALREEGDGKQYAYRAAKWDISIHALREEGDNLLPAGLVCCVYFYPRPPRGGRRPKKPAKLCMRCYFYPRPPRGGRPTLGYIKTLADVFLSTPSARRATFIAVVKTRCFYYFYPRPPRGGRHKILDAVCRVDGISIHALREEGDLPDSTVAITLLEISIHALREEGDIRPASLPCGMMNFYPRPPRGGRRKIKV